MELVTFQKLHNWEKIEVWTTNGIEDIHVCKNRTGKVKGTLSQSLGDSTRAERENDKKAGARALYHLPSQLSSANLEAKTPVPRPTTEMLRRRLGAPAGCTESKAGQCLLQRPQLAFLSFSELK